MTCAELHIGAWASDHKLLVLMFLPSHYTPACCDSDCGCRIHPNEVMTFTIDRKGESLEVPVTPAEAPDGTGRIGVQLAANAQVTRKISKDPLEAVQLAAGQFGKLTKTIVTGKRLLAHHLS